MPARFLPYLCISLLLAACGGGGSGGGTTPTDIGPSPGPIVPPPVVELSVADPGSPYSSILVACAAAETVADSCSLGDLPLLGQATANPTIDDVLARTVVSHAWMGTRLRQALEIMPPDILTLMKGVTAVVISSEVNPSFYSTTSGAIFIDPYFLWLTNAEKAAVSQDPDFRADFGRDLAFVSLWRYVIGTSYAWDYYGLDGNETRTIGDIYKQFASLLFHELAHANDAFPPSEVGRLDAAMSVRAAAESLEDRRISAQLSAHMPLNSQMLLDLARVMYHGDPATAAQRAISAAVVGLEFQSDGASDDYAYASEWEDLAMLFEEVMMHRHFNIDREIAYTNVPATGEERYCDSYVVRWGVRNRIGDPLVRSRAEFGLQLLLDRSDVSSYLDPMPSQ